MNSWSGRAGLRLELGLYSRGEECLKVKGREWDMIVIVFLELMRPRPVEQRVKVTSATADRIPGIQRLGKRREDERHE